MKEADIHGAKFTRADFYRCNLRGAKGLETAHDLETGQVHATIVTEEDLATIFAAMRESSLFEVHALDEQMGRRPPASPAG